ncbi:MAG: hypothetical protein KGI49_00675 [Patescibacteria group bacterium]|nr:hypothetical protein [Patescibacteria group bacterium]
MTHKKFILFPVAMLVVAVSVSLAASAQAATTSALYNAPLYRPYSTSLDSYSNIPCKYPNVIDIPTARALISALNLNATQTAALLNPADLYLYKTVVFPGATTYVQNGPDTMTTIGLCISPGFVSNLPVGISPSTILNAGTPLKIFSNTTTDYTDGNHLGLTSGNFSTTVQTASAATVSSHVSYSVNVNYNQFTSEAQKYGYNDVYSTTGTKTVSITVLKFSGSQYVTAQQALSLMSAAGYRPATLSEVYALKSQAGSNIVGLGTLLGTNWGYPITGGSGSAGMSLSKGPFNTSVLSFAAVAQ